MPPPMHLLMHRTSTRDVLFMDALFINTLIAVDGVPLVRCIEL
jgi:hypothetical protein